RLKGVVAVDDRGVDVAERAGQGGRLQFAELQAVRFRDVIGGGLGAGAVGEFDDAVLGEQVQGPAAVGGVVGDGDGVTGGQLTDVAQGLGVHPQRLQVDVDHRDDVGALVGIELVQVGPVLEVVGVHLA